MPPVLFEIAARRAHCRPRFGDISNHEFVGCRPRRKGCLRRAPHLHLFTLSDGTKVSPLDWWGGEAPDDTVDGHATKLSRLQAGEQFAYVFDMGDDWAHLCTVTDRRIDPVDELGETPDRPVPFWGWGSLPDQYARRWDGDDGESPTPKRPARGFSDLPPILPWWGVHRRG